MSIHRFIIDSSKRLGAVATSRAFRRFLVLSLSVTAGFPVAAQPRPSFRAGVDLVSLSVTVTDSGGRYVGDLSAHEFAVLEDSRPQELVFFSRATSALAVSLLIDSSASMEDELPFAQKAASEFVTRLRPGDSVQIIDFDSRVQVLQPFTADRNALERAISSVESGGSTSLYNAIYIALRQLGTLRARDGAQHRREVVVVLSDGHDTSSLVGFEELLETARRSHGVIYAIALGARLNTSRSRLERPDRDFELRRLAQETGGRLLVANGAASLATVYNRIADELTSQYVLGYLSSNAQRGDGWRSISVRVSRSNLQVRTRPGYHVTSHALPVDR